MNFNRLCLAVLAAGSLIPFSTTHASAQSLIDPGTIVAPVPLTGFFGGTQIDSASSLYTGTASNGQTISGTLVSAVYQGGSGATGLDFYYQLNVDGTSTQGIGSISLSSWVGSTAFVAQTAQDIDGSGAFVAGGISPVAAQRNSSGSGIQFDFGTSSVQAGANSTTLIVRSDAIVFTNQGTAAILGAAGVSANTTGNVLSANAVTAAPEPSAVALLACAVPVAGLIVHRRKKRLQR